MGDAKMVAKITTVTVGPFATNCYIIGLSEGQCVVVDPGDDPELILSAIEGRQALAVLLTHGHFDHVAAAADVAEMTGAEVWAHVGDRPWLEGQWELWGLRAPRVRYNYFRDDDAPFGIRTIHTPGHSPGSVCYLFDGAVCCGDTIFASSVGRVDLPGGSERELVSSLRRLKTELPPESVLLPGHGPATALADELRSNPWLINDPAC
ncbi:MAG: MBL fold metallo-hydrolase [Armatimonadetes bacterium]|nr:MBL fold metallo-hydrolase [Armatimonadota bacterium]